MKADDPSSIIFGAMRTLRFLDGMAAAMRHQHLELGELHRHRHEIGYAALVLSGAYEEAGDTGRWRVETGDIVYHRAYEAHRNRIGCECEILNVGVPSCLHLPAVFKIKEPDELLAAAASKDTAIAQYLVPSEAKQPVISDWPDLLARDLRNGPEHLGEWAEKSGLRPETISRGFRKVYGIAPAQYRREALTRVALRMIANAERTLADVASFAGFADQAHMTRSVVSLTGYTPGQWRKAKSNPFKTAPLQPR